MPPTELLMDAAKDLSLSPKAIAATLDARIGDAFALFGMHDTRAGIGDRNRVVAQGVSLTGEFQLSDLLTFKSISAYREGATNTVIDFDNTALPTLDVPAEYDDWQFTQELQLLFLSKSNPKPFEG